jgi:hypothetical protein
LVGWAVIALFVAFALNLATRLVVQALPSLLALAAICGVAYLAVRYFHQRGGW